MAEDTHRGFGEVLQQAREAAGLQISDLAATTRISTRYIAALEAEDWDVVPASVIGRGFVRVLARELRQDPDRLLEAYRQSRGEVGASPDHSLPESDWDVALRSERNRRPVWVGIVALLLLLAGMWFWFPRTVEQDQPVPVDKVSTPLPAPPESSAPTAPEEAAPPAAEVPAAALEPASEVEPTEPKEHRLGIQAVEKVWVRVEVDGGKPRDRMLSPGERVEYTGQRGIRIKVGNAGSVRLTWDDSALRVPGARGEVKTLEFPAAAAALRP